MYIWYKQIISPYKVYKNYVHCNFIFPSLSLSLSLVLQKGVDVNAELLNGRNPLHYAADYGHTDVLNYLISKGGKVDVS